MGKLKSGFFLFIFFVNMDTGAKHCCEIKNPSGCKLIRFLARSSGNSDGRTAEHSELPSRTGGHNYPINYHNQEEMEIKIWVTWSYSWWWYIIKNITKPGLGLLSKCAQMSRTCTLYISHRPWTPPASRGLTSVSAVDNSWRGVFSFNNTVLVYQLWGCGLALCNVWPQT